jgi:hypothetical protein
MRALSVLASLITAPGDVRRHNRRVLREYEDLVRWARDDVDREKDAIADLPDLDRQQWRQSLEDPLAEERRRRPEVLRRISREHAQRWRDRSSQSTRLLEDLADSENVIHRGWRRVARKQWPTNPHAEELAELTRDWDEFISDENL